MNNGKPNKHTQFERALTELEMAIKSGKITDPLIQEYWRHGLSPLGNGEHGAKAQAILENLLTGPAILANLALPSEPAEPEIDPGLLVLIGSSCSRWQTLMPSWKNIESL